MKNYIRAALAGVVLALALALSASAANVGAAKVTADVLNFRDAPSTDGSILGSAPYGSVVLVLEQSGGWCRVRWAGQEGYMSGNYLSLLDEADLSLGTGTMTGEGVRFREAPSLDAAVHRYLYLGDQVTITGVAGAWYRVSYAGSEGYVYSDYVALGAESGGGSALGQAIVDEAKLHLDIRYQWGGTAPEEGFDCSGLVYYCCAKNGLKLNRTASTLYTQGVSVKKDELQVGDLVFFASPTAWNVSHVGLYIGDGQFIHASSGAGKVTTSKLDAWYYSTYYYGARRVTG